MPAETSAPTARSFMLRVTSLDGLGEDGTRIRIKANKGRGIPFVLIDPALKGVASGEALSDEGFDQLLASVGLQRIVGGAS